jgi:NDP-sugar pyrophosphorylase family protein
VRDYYQRHPVAGLHMSYSIGTAEDLTGRRVLNAYEQLEDKFLLLYGDNYWPVPLEHMKVNYQRLGVAITTTIFNNKDGRGEYGFENNALVSRQGMVTAYDKSRQLAGLNGVDIGFFLVDKKAIDPGEQGNISFEETILARMAKAGRLGAFKTDEPYYYITSLEHLHYFEQVVREKNFVAGVTERL